MWNLSMSGRKIRLVGMVGSFAECLPSTAVIDFRNGDQKEDQEKKISGWQKGCTAQGREEIGSGGVAQECS
jgi:hypothetical protein